jgi:hypothetical protein
MDGTKAGTKGERAGGGKGGRFVGHHLIVVSHGMWGKPIHTDYLAGQLRTRTQRTTVLNLTCNSGLRSYAGVQTCGARAAVAVRAEAARCGATGVSFIGYSAGGLWVQHAAMELERAGFFDEVRPLLFVAVASPLIGVFSPPEHRSHFCLYRYVVNCGGMNCAGCLGGRTVEEIFLSDDREEPLLLRMASPTNEYGKALARFQRRISFGNTRNDFLVPFESSGLARSNPFPEWVVQGKTQKRGDDEVRGNNVRIQMVRSVMPLPGPVRPEEAWSSEENLERPRLPSSYCCEFLQGVTYTVVLFGLWLPIMSTFSLGFMVPIMFGLCARRTFDKARPANAFFPCHCFRGQRRVATKVWHEALVGRLQQKFEVVPVRFTRGNAHAKIINRPACCFTDCYAEGRGTVGKIVELFVEVDDKDGASLASAVDAAEIAVEEAATSL